MDSIVRSVPSSLRYLINLDKAKRRLVSVLLCFVLLGLFSFLVRYSNAYIGNEKRFVSSCYAIEKNKSAGRGEGKYIL